MYREFVANLRQLKKRRQSEELVIVKVKEVQRETRRSRISCEKWKMKYSKHKEHKKNIKKNVRKLK